MNIIPIVFFIFCVSVALAIGGATIHAAACGVAVWSGITVLLAISL